ncbi:uncharacterized protein [Solanum lycopersicum]|uniref:uncharacterized protein n=1 Tax=Solanum lycopersicum TaxID=4081 RepID=UPI003749CDD7
MVRDCPQVNNQFMENVKPRPNANAVAEPPKRNMFYALKGKEEREKLDDVVTGTLHVLNLPVYALLDSRSTLSFVTPLIASRFDMLPEILHDPILVSTPIEDIIRAEKVHKKCPIKVLDIVTHVDLADLDMLYFDILLGMDWLHKFYATIDCRNRVSRFQFSNKLELEWEGRGSSLVGQIVSNLEDNQMIAKGYLYHLVRFNDLDQEVPSIDSVPIVNEFPDVFPEDLPGVTPEREIDFCVVLDTNTKQIYFTQYRIERTELKELKLQLKDLLDKGFIQPSISP